ncbi:MAG: response regulator [Candidatus Promineifilaceae bacterium]
MEPVLFSLAVGLNILGATLLLSVLSIILWLSWRARINRLLALYVGICLIWSLSALTARLVMTSNVFNVVNGVPFLLVYIILIAIAGNSPFLFAFVVEYIGLWHDKRLQIARWVAFALNSLVTVIFWVAPNMLVEGYGVTPIGMITIEPQPIALPILGASYFLWYGYSIYLLWKHSWPRGKWIALGASAIAISLAFEIVSSISDILPISIVLAGIGSAAFAYTILQDTVFNPLKRKNKELQQSRKELEQVLTTIPGAVFISNLQGKILWANAESAQILGIEHDELLQQNVFKFYASSALQSDVGEKLRNMDRIDKHEIQFLTHAGDARWGRLDVVNTQYQGTAAQLGIMQDIHEQKQAQESLQSMQKWESLALLAGGIAHDFNNLLVAMLGQASIAKIKIGEAHPGYRHVKKVEQAAVRASKLTNQMLAYSGRGQFEIRPIQLNTLVADSFHLLEASITKSVELRTNFYKPLPYIEADTAQMQQVFMNLIINASQAIGDQPGYIEVVTSVCELTEDHTEGWHFTGETLAPGRYVTIEIQDSGKGIDEATLQSIFDPFFTTKASGSGLGLAAVLGIVRGHKGGIQVFSELGQGTLFRLLLPAANCDVKPVMPVSAETQLSPSISKKVLIIDDEPAVTEVVQDILEAEGIPAMIAHGGAEGIDLYRTQQASIALVLLDLSMPGLNGEDVFNAIHKINPNVRVILSSGYSQLEATRHFIGRDLAGFIQKPYDYETLLKNVSPYLSNTT